MNLFDEITSALHAAKEKLFGFLSSAEKAAVTAIKNMNISDSLIAAAEKAVVDAETAFVGKAGSGRDKFAAAVDAVAADFSSQASGAIQTAVQIAWASMTAAGASISIATQTPSSAPSS